VKAELLGVDAPVWNSFLTHARHDFYHLPSYAAICAAQEGGDAQALHITHGGRRVLLPLIVRPIRGGGYDAVSPYGYPGPVVIGPADADFMRSALTAGMRLLGTQGIVSLFVRLHPLLNIPPPERLGQIVQHGDTIVIDLTLPEEELWNQTRPNHRSQINRAVRAGREAKFDEAWSHFGAFKRLYRETMTKVSAASYFFFDEAYFDDLKAALGERIRLCVVEVDQTVAVAALFVETGGIVQYHLSGSDPAFAREGLTKLMFHFVRTWAKERGNRYFHLGGGLGPADDPLLHFKAGFSPLRQSYYTLRAILNEGEYERLVQARAAGHGPLETGFFPAYRAPRGGSYRPSASSIGDHGNAPR